MEAWSVYSGIHGLVWPVSSFRASSFKPSTRSSSSSVLNPSSLSSASSSGQSCYMLHLFVPSLVIPSPALCIIVNAPLAKLLNNSFPRYFPSCCDAILADGFIWSNKSFNDPRFYLGCRLELPGDSGLTTIVSCITMYIQMKFCSILDWYNYLSHNQIWCALIAWGSLQLH